MKCEFYWQNVTKDLLRDKGFKYSRAYSSEDGEAYIGMFTVYKWNLVDVIAARIIVYLDGQVKVDIIDKGTKGLYATYYNYDSRRAPIVNKIDKNLNRILKELGVRRYVKSKNKKTA